MLEKYRLVLYPVIELGMICFIASLLLIGTAYRPPDFSSIGIKVQDSNMKLEEKDILSLFICVIICFSTD